MNPNLKDDLQVWYSTPGRHYHTFAHVEEVLAHYRFCFHLIEKRDEVFAAILWHDAIYVVGAATNEEASAALMRREAPRWFPGMDLDFAEDLIHKTASHGQHQDEAGDTALFLDCDMAILGQNPDRYREYAAQVAAEWAPVAPAELYKIGRARFLQDVLGAERIYISDFWADRLEDQARLNLMNELAGLTP